MMKTQVSSPQTHGVKLSYTNSRLVSPLFATGGLLMGIRKGRRR